MHADLALQPSRTVTSVLTECSYGTVRDLSTAIKISPSSMFITGAMVLHNSVCPHVFHTLKGTLHLLENTGPPPILRCVIMWLACVWPHHVGMKRPCVRVERRRQARGGAMYPSATEEVLSWGMFLTASCSFTQNNLRTHFVWTSFMYSYIRSTIQLHGVM